MRFNYSCAYKRLNKRNKTACVTAGVGNTLRAFDFFILSAKLSKAIRPIGVCPVCGRGINNGGIAVFK